MQLTLKWMAIVAGSCVALACGPEMDPGSDTSGTQESASGDTGTDSDDDDDTSSTSVGSEDGDSDSSSTGLAPVCGNDSVEGNEACDGLDLAGEDCVSLGFDDGVLGCNADCSGFDTRACEQAECGDDLREGDEVCDGTDLGGETCISQNYGEGTLSCDADCGSFDTNRCSPPNCEELLTERACNPFYCAWCPEGDGSCIEEFGPCPPE